MNIPPSPQRPLPSKPQSPTPNVSLPFSLRHLQSLPSIGEDNNKVTDTDINKKEIYEVKQLPYESHIRFLDDDSSPRPSLSIDSFPQSPSFSLSSSKSPSSKSLSRTSSLKFFPSSLKSPSFKSLSKSPSVTSPKSVQYPSLKRAFSFLTPQSTRVSEITIPEERPNRRILPSYRGQFWSQELPKYTHRRRSVRILPSQQKAIETPYLIYTPTPIQPSLYTNSEENIFNALQEIRSREIQSHQDTLDALKALFVADTIKALKTSGKSGDALWLLVSYQQKYIIKTSMNEAFTNEHETTLKVYDLFKSEPYNPIVQIYGYGQIKLSTSVYFYVMEYLNLSPNPIIPDYLMLSDYLEGADIQTKIQVFKEWLRVIITMKLSGYSHCDLHPENIIVNTDTKRIKIIDFGIATTEFKKCRQGRSMTKKMLDFMIEAETNTLGKIRYAMNLPTLALNKSKDSDLSMYLTMFDFAFDPEPGFISDINTLNEEYFETDEIDDKKQYLNTFYSEIIRYLDEHVF